MFPRNFYTNEQFDELTRDKYSIYFYQQFSEKHVQEMLQTDNQACLHVLVTAYCNHYNETIENIDLNVPFLLNIIQKNVSNLIVRPCLSALATVRNDLTDEIIEYDGLNILVNLLINQNDSNFIKKILTILIQCITCIQRRDLIIFQPKLLDSIYSIILDENQIDIANHVIYFCNALFAFKPYPSSNQALLNMTIFILNLDVLDLEAQAIGYNILVSFDPQLVYENLVSLPIFMKVINVFGRSNDLLNQRILRLIRDQIIYDKRVASIILESNLFNNPAKMTVLFKRHAYSILNILQSCIQADMAKVSITNSSIIFLIIKETYSDTPLVSDLALRVLSYILFSNVPNQAFQDNRAGLFVDKLIRQLVYEMKQATRIGFLQKFRQFTIVLKQISEELGVQISYTDKVFWTFAKIKRKIAKQEIKLQEGLINQDI